MVELSTIVDSNDSFANRHQKGKVCVFSGATAGIGFGTLRRMVTMLESSTFYVLGRNKIRFEGRLQELQLAGKEHDNTVNFIEVQVALISSVDAACAQIMTAESKVDYVCLSAGGMPFKGETRLEECFTISYYSRLRMIANLMPLINQSSSPRVLSILNGTKEKRIREDDLGLDKQWSIMGVVNHTTICTSLAFDHLAANDDKKHLTLIHATPGLVNTGSPKQGPIMKNGYLWWAFITVLRVISRWIIKFVGAPLPESGERHAFYLTSDMYKPGSLRTDNKNEIVPDNAALTHYKENGWMDIIWEHTLSVWDRALAKEV